MPVGGSEQASELLIGLLNELLAGTTNSGLITLKARFKCAVPEEGSEQAGQLFNGLLTEPLRLRYIKKQNSLGAYLYCSTWCSTPAAGLGAVPLMVHGHGWHMVGDVSNLSYARLIAMVPYSCSIAL